MCLHLGEYTINGWSSESIRVQTSLLNPIQAKNMEVVLTVCQKLLDDYPLSEQTIINGFKSLRLPARFERLFSDRRWFFDGFHNEESLDLVLDIVSQETSKPFFILAFMRDKWTKSLAKKVKKLDALMISLDNERSLTKKDAPELNWGSFSSIDEIFNNFNKSLVIVGGSFYFYRNIKEWMSLFRT
jgi:folylpolyglutamate synthase/dihydropteroate synthase